MSVEVFPKAYRIMIWVISTALIFLIVLTGFIASQVASIDKEVQQLRSTGY
ncbi:MAG TPA: hypothetical protein VJK50_02425 [Patescibacteria group bacterium]|nr:hypothetical protein [Patescibacteria group bacterium]